MTRAIQRFLATGPEPIIMRLWADTAPFANWLDCRESEGRLTYLVMVDRRDEQEFLSAARAVAATVEEIHHGDDGETYRLRTGEPSTGWAPAPLETT